MSALYALLRALHHETTIDSIGCDMISLAGVSREVNVALSKAFVLPTRKSIPAEVTDIENESPIEPDEFSYYSDDADSEREESDEGGAPSFGLEFQARTWANLIARSSKNSRLHEISLFRLKPIDPNDLAFNLPFENTLVWLASEMTVATLRNNFMMFLAGVVIAWFSVGTKICEIQMADEDVSEPCFQRGSPIYCQTCGECRNAVLCKLRCARLLQSVGQVIMERFQRQISLSTMLALFQAW